MSEHDLDPVEGMDDADEPQPPPPLPYPDAEGCRLRSGVSGQRRRLARRRLLRPAVLLVIGLAVFALLGALQPSSGPLLPPVVEEAQERLPPWLADLDLLQVLLLPFLVIGVLELLRGAHHVRQAARASLSIDRVGRLEQLDGIREHVDLDHLVHVDVAPNTAFTAINERTPVGSLFLLRLADAMGQEVDVNPGMWAQERRVTDTIRHYAWHGNAAITDEAAERYGLPVRGRGGHDHIGPAARDDQPLHSDDEREALTRARGIDLRRLPDDPSAPARQGAASRVEPEGDPSVREGGVEVEGGAEVEADRLDDQ